MYIRLQRHLRCLVHQSYEGDHCRGPGENFWCHSVQVINSRSRINDNQSTHMLSEKSWTHNQIQFGRCLRLHWLPDVQINQQYFEMLLWSFVNLQLLGHGPMPSMEHPTCTRNMGRLKATSMSSTCFDVRGQPVPAGASGKCLRVWRKLALNLLDLLDVYCWYCWSDTQNWPQTNMCNTITLIDKLTQVRISEHSRSKIAAHQLSIRIYGCT